MQAATQTLRERIATAAHMLREGLLDLLYPPRCLGCHARTPHAAPLCAACLTGLEQPSPERVQQRLDQLPEAEDIFASTFALWHFDPDGALRALQHALKYQNRPRYGQVAGRWLGSALCSTLPADSLDAVVPVPLHRTRRLERGYNQSMMLARGAAEHLGLPCRPEWLVRPRPTRSQTHLSRRARWRNVAEAFAAPQPLDGPTVLIIDDVLTTGATATAAARALLHAGAASVHLATLALAE